MKKVLALACFAVNALSGCSGPADSLAKKGLETLDAAYVLRVKPENAAFTRCEYQLYEGLHVVRCGISFGSTELAQKGFWEIDVSSGVPVLYAMNGKALAALEKIGVSEEFKSGVGRESLDIQGIEARF